MRPLENNFVSRTVYLPRGVVGVVGVVLHMAGQLGLHFLYDIQLSFIAHQLHSLYAYLL